MVEKWKNVCYNASGNPSFDWTILRGRTVIGENCQIGPQVMLTDCTVGQGCTINASQCEESTIEKNCQIGPYTHIRPHCVVGEGSHIGAFVQLKNSVLGNTNLVPPVQVGDGAFIAAATTVTRDVPPDALAVGRQRQQVKEGWAAENRRLKGRKA